MKRTFYHGTSADNLQNILKHGISCNEIKIWNCSLDQVYLWDADKLAEYDQIEDEEYKQRLAFTRASESGQIALSLSNDCRIVVLKVIIDDSEIFDDTSCRNMETSGAVCINRNIELYEISEIKISNDLSLLKGYFISMILDRENSNIEFNDLEKRIGKIFQEAEIYPEDIEDSIEWEEVPVKVN